MDPIGRPPALHPEKAREVAGSTAPRRNRSRPARVEEDLVAPPPAQSRFPSDEAKAVSWGSAGAGWASCPIPLISELLPLRDAQNSYESGHYLHPNEAK